MTSPDHHLLTVSEALEILGISRATFDRWKKDKQLPYIKIGKEVFVNKHKLEAWMAGFDHSLQRTNFSAHAIPVHIGYQSSSAQLWSSIVIKRLNLLQKQLQQDLPQYKLDIQWHHANNGIELVQQFLSDRLHFIAVGDYPLHISFNLAKLFPSFNPLLIAFDGKTVSNEGIALVLQQAQHTKPAQEIQYQYKKLATQPLHIAAVPSTSSSYYLHQYMKKQEDSFQTVEKSSMDQCMNSFLQHEVDGAMLWEPYLTIVERLGAGKRIEMDKNTVYLTGILTHQNLLKDTLQQQITISYLKSLLAAHQLLRQGAMLAFKAIEEETGLDVSIIEAVCSRIRFDAAVYHEDIKRINNIYTSSIGQHILNTELNVQASPKINFDALYLNEAIKQLELPMLPKHGLTGSWNEQCY